MSTYDLQCQAKYYVMKTRRSNNGRSPPYVWSFSCSESFVPDENSRNHYMWLHGPCSLPEYGGKKKNPNPAWNRSQDVWASGLPMRSMSGRKGVALNFDPNVTHTHTLHSLSLWVDLTRSTVHSVVCSQVWKHGTVTWISSGTPSLHILFNSLYTNNPTMQLLCSLSYWKHS